MGKTVTHVTIDLLDAPHSGDRQVITRYQFVDKLLVDNAAFRLGMSTATFNRMVTTKAAQAVMNELDEEVPAVEEVVEEVVIKEPKPRSAKMSLSRHVPPGVKFK